MRKRGYTVRKVLTEGGDLLLGSIPFGKAIVLFAPEDIDLEPTMSARETLTLLENEGFQSFLKLPIEDLLAHDEHRRVRGIIKCAYVTGLFSCLVATGAIAYIAIATMTFPDFYDLLIPLVSPALIMWKQAGVLEGDRLKKAAELIKEVSPFNRFGSNKKKEDMSDEETPRP